MNYEPVYRTATATPGLLNTLDHMFILCWNNVYNTESTRKNTLWASTSYTSTEHVTYFMSNVCKKVLSFEGGVLSTLI